MQRIKSGDQVIVIAGKDKGQRGEVVRFIRDKSKKISKVIVSGVNMVKKHVRPDPNRNQQGGIVEKEAPIHISNVAIYNSISGKADRIGYKMLDDGRKVRYFKSNGELVDV